MAFQVISYGAVLRINHSQRKETASAVRDEQRAFLLAFSNKRPLHGGAAVSLICRLRYAFAEANDARNRRTKDVRPILSPNEPSKLRESFLAVALPPYGDTPMVKSGDAAFSPIPNTEHDTKWVVRKQNS